MSQHEYIQSRKRTFKDVGVLVGEALDDGIHTEVDEPMGWSIEGDLMFAEFIVDGVSYRVELREAVAP